MPGSVIPYLIDTNTVSELRKVRRGLGDPNVAAWADMIPYSDMFLSVLTIRELEWGVLRAERRDATGAHPLRAWLDQYIPRAFAGRILPVTAEIAKVAAHLHIPNPVPEIDALIAATAIVHGMTVATRNVRDFDRTGVALLNPWDFKTPPNAPA